MLYALGVARLHMVGLPMGGGTAQRLAPERRARPATRSLVCTSPIHDSIEGLPSTSLELQETFAAEQPETDSADRTPSSTPP